MPSTIVTSIIASIAALSSVQAAGIDEVSLTFYTAPSNDQFHQVFPTNLTSIPIENPMTVTHIYNPGGAQCVITGTKGESVNVPIGDHKLQEPQPLKSGFCGGL
ncbi:hypothetical protein FE257_009127 [Aspergillus nanangensis]|uniref:Uncharacterized protein n=1 Tax=Aspergillus nanangensis TaxID=2582783 RepID=A0AAD4CWR8_ASPNN|nr:hypothetical protein FE257_009127 [Aspergillus nanangensis]